MKVNTSVARLLIAALLLGGCSSSYQSKKQREIERTRKERQKESTQQYQDAVKRHETMQSKETRKRIKKNKGKAGPPKEKETFFQRLF